MTENVRTETTQHGSLFSFASCDTSGVAHTGIRKPAGMQWGPARAEYSVFYALCGRSGAEWYWTTDVRGRRDCKLCAKRIAE